MTINLYNKVKLQGVCKYDGTITLRQEKSHFAIKEDEKRV